MTWHTEAATSLSLIAGAAFASADLGKLVKVTDDDTVTLIDAITDTVAGILGEASAPLGQTIPVVLLQGVVKVQAGGAVSAGNILIPAADGQVTAVLAIDNIPADAMGVGVALEDGVDGQMISMLAMALVSTLSA